MTPDDVPPSDLPEDRRPHPAPCNWSGGALCVCPVLPADAPEVDPAEWRHSEGAPADGWDRERNAIANLKGANWAGWQLREAREQIAANAKMAEAELEELARKVRLVRERQVKADASFVARAEFFRNRLEVWAATNKAEALRGLHPDAQSRRLPSGVVLKWKRRKEGSYRWDPEQTPAENGADLLAWAKAEEKAIGARLLTKDGPEVVDLDAVKEYAAHVNKDVAIPDDPMTIPGLEYVAPGETLSIEVDGEEK